MLSQALFSVLLIAGCLLLYATVVPKEQQLAKRQARYPASWKR